MTKIKERVWIGKNGHRVAVKFFFHQDNGTIHDRINKFSRTHYQCECGRTFDVSSRPRKSHLDSHDSWTTPEEAQNISRIIFGEARA